MTRQEFTDSNSELLIKQKSRIDLEQQLKSLMDKQRQLSQQMMSDICSAVDPDNPSKPLYSNDAKRASELTIRQLNSEEYLGYDNLILNCNRNLAELSAEISFLHNNISYALNHAADEVNEMLADFAARVDKVVNVAAYNAVKHILSEIAVNAINKAEKVEDDYKAEQEPTAAA